MMASTDRRSEICVQNEFMFVLIGHNTALLILSDTFLKEVSLSFQ